MSALNKSDRMGALRHRLFEAAQTVFREPGGLLRHPYVHPGGPYGDNQWDWDSYGVLKAVSCMIQADPDRLEYWRNSLIRHGSGVLDNVVDWQGTDGSFPILMTPEDTDWFDSTKSSQENLAKPVYGLILHLLAEQGVSGDRLLSWCEALDGYYGCYAGRQKHESGLYVWANDVAIGTDDDPTGYGRPPFSSASVLLNSFLYADLRAAQAVAEQAGDSVRAKKWAGQAMEIAEAMNTYCWDTRDGFFYTADVSCAHRARPHRHFGMLHENLEPFWKCLPLKILYWTGFLPMWAGMATAEQADRLVKEHLLNESEFWAPWGIRSLSPTERMYDPVTSRGNPSNWLGPVWLMSNYLVWEGLKAYGYLEEANVLAERSIELLDRDTADRAGWHEYYQPETGEAISGPGFVSWNLLVFTMLEDLK